MKDDKTRGCDRKNIDQPLSFEISAVQRRSMDTKKNGVTVDISSCGLGIKTKYALEEGSVLKFNFPIREVEVTIPVYAQVMWSVPANDHFRAGLRFLA